MVFAQANTPYRRELLPRIPKRDLQGFFDFFQGCIRRDAKQIVEVCVD